MELGEFTQALGSLSVDDLHRVTAALDARSASAAGEVDAWRATLGIDRALRRAHLVRVAARAASDASHAVQRAAAAWGLRLPDAEVTHVARAAAEVARGLVAGPDAAGEVRHLLCDWAPVLGVAV
jgi:hypothetical protein